MKMAREGLRFQLRDVASSKALMWGLAIITVLLGLFSIYRLFVPAEPPR